ncbi:MAG TPA: tetratricopeptide repeat protein, partial [Kofleriaceae bacterium]|nr:tetratricopeptide repeat protein [Kofleriaceae bacterium]
MAAQPAGDWGVKRDPFNPTDIARYKAILRASPHDAGALAKLLELYRRYRTLDLLKDEYGKQIDKNGNDVAALIVMGRLQHATGDDARALELFSAAVAKRDDDAQTWLLIGELDKQAARPKDARAAYEKALAHAQAKDGKRKALRALADLALAGNDADAANAYFQQFLELDPKNAQLWIERGDAMLAAGKRELALDSYTAAEKLLGADPAKRVEVVARRGQALEGMARDDDAVAEYRRAIKLAPKGYYLEVELTGRIVDIFRRKQALPQLLAQYEKDWPEAARDHFEWDTLGKLYEETGAQDKAIAALKRAVAKAPWELETQRRLIQLLENSGRDDEALVAYEAVVRAAPGEARFQLDLAERYWRRGQEKKGLDTLTRLEQRFPQDTGVLSAIADLYMRWGKEDLAIVEYERLAKLEPD